MDTTQDMEFANVPAGMHAFSVMGRNGDTKTIWDPTKSVEVEAAREQFNSLRKKGYAAFRVTGKDGVKGEQMNEFDADAGRIIFAPAMAGG